MSARDRIEPPVGGTLKYIESMIPALVPSEQKVARAIVDRPQEVALLSAAELAERTATSAATIIRASQSLGFKGFQQLRLLLLRDESSEPVLSPHAESGDTSQWLPALFRAAGEELKQSTAPLDFAAFDRAVDALARSSRLLIVGNGGSAPVAQMAAVGFLFAGWRPEAPVDAVMQQLTAATLGTSDVCLCISSSGSNELTIKSAQAAFDAGAIVITITGFRHSKIAELSAITLICGTVTQTWPTGTTAANLGQFVLLAGLQSAAARLAGRVTSDPSVANEVIHIVAPDEEPGAQSPDSH